MEILHRRAWARVCNRLIIDQVHFDAFLLVPRHVNRRMVRRLTCPNNFDSRYSMREYLVFPSFNTTGELALYVRCCTLAYGKTYKELMISIHWNIFGVPYSTLMTFSEALRWQRRRERGFPPRHFLWKLDYRLIPGSVITRAPCHPQMQSALSWNIQPLGAVVRD